MKLTGHRQRARGSPPHAPVMAESSCRARGSSGLRLAHASNARASVEAAGGAQLSSDGWPRVSRNAAVISSRDWRVAPCSPASGRNSESVYGRRAVCRYSATSAAANRCVAVAGAGFARTTNACRPHTHQHPPGV
jgi:hypothetical protein